MSSFHYLAMTLHVLAFAFWSSFWPRRAIKQRIEPRVGFRAYRLFYNAGTIVLFCLSFGYLAQHTAETPALWNLRSFPWFRPLIYAINGLGVFLLSAAAQLGPSFWGFVKPPPDRGLQTNGFYKITRHPLYWSVFCLLFSHTLVFGSVLAVLYFALMETYNIIGVIAFENRQLAANYGEALRSFHARTSTVPFRALFQGRVRLSRGELPRFAITGSIVFTIVVGLFHGPILERLIYALPSIASLH